MSEPINETVNGIIYSQDGLIASGISPENTIENLEVRDTHFPAYLSVRFRKKHSSILISILNIF